MAWTVRRPNGRYTGYYRTPDGKRRSAGTFDHKKRALNEAAAKEGTSRELGWRDPGAAARTWGEWCETWWPTRAVEPSTLREEGYVRDLHLLPRWGEVRLIDITRFDLKAWAAEMLAAGAAQATVQKRINIMSASLNGAIDAEIPIVNVAARIKVVRGTSDTRRYLTHKETRRLLKRTPVEFDRDVISLLLGTGMRWGEMVGLQIPRVSLKRRTIRVAETWDTKTGALKAYTKSGNSRNVPIPEWLVPVLERLIGKRKEGHVVLWQGERLKYTSWRKRAWIPAVKTAKLTGTRIHDLRHTFASWHLQAGTSLAEVGKLLGHASAATTQIYAHLAEEFSGAVKSALDAPWSDAKRVTKGIVTRLRSTG
ncbi:tyrosine-type recombinase/integrase [Agromyces sp. NPDC058104]|uniref:tyrosine-type recombinase/integrase n=1 Tax=Agromyces sp. NPDC058104 TaxID=3346342 RepID=UPI0036DB18E7